MFQRLERIERGKRSTSNQMSSHRGNMFVCQNNYLCTQNQILIKGIVREHLDLRQKILDKSNLVFHFVSRFFHNIYLTILCQFCIVFIKLCLCKLWRCRELTVVASWPIWGAITWLKVHNFPFLSWGALFNAKGRQGVISKDGGGSLGTSAP